MNLIKLDQILQNEPKYRANQAREFVFKKFIGNWSEATSLPQNLQEKLNKECPLEITAQALISKNKDSVKAKITLADGAQIETVLIMHSDGRNTVCVSSQVGCPMNCAFCATGKIGFSRNLTSEEIIEQVLFFNRYLKKSTLSGVKGLRVTNVTFMGMGEPFLNYENIIETIKILNNPDFFGISIRNISISTCGVINGIERLANSGLQVNLAISLHAPDNELRSRLMPINKKYPLEKVMEAVDKYIVKTKRKVMFEYVLIKDINDTDRHAQELAKLMSKKLYFLNLIEYNDTGMFKASDRKRIEEFKKILRKFGINFVQRYKFGQDIKAACGQFANNK